MRKKTFNSATDTALQAKRRSFLFSWFVVVNTVFGNVASIYHDNQRRGL